MASEIGRVNEPLIGLRYASSPKWVKGSAATVVFGANFAKVNKPDQCKKSVPIPFLVTIFVSCQDIKIEPDLARFLVSGLTTKCDDSIPGKAGVSPEAAHSTKMSKRRKEKEKKYVISS